MKLKVDFDHAYTMDLNHKIWKELGKCGFTLDPQCTEHPGKAFCRFIMFVDGKTRERVCLEFVHQKSAGKGGTPGLSFQAPEGLEKFYKRVKKKSKIPLVFSHKNYEWKKDSVSRLPGWNFMGFEKNPIKEFFPWFTEFEFSKKRKKPKFVKHKNGIYKIRGAVVGLNAKGQRSLEFLLGQKLKGKMISESKFNLDIVKARSNSFQTIILNTKSLEKTAKFFPKGEFQVVDGIRSLRVPLANKKSKGWDLQIIEG